MSGLKAGHSKVIYFITDALSTVRDVVNSSGTVVASYEFDEYGRRISTSESGVSTQKTFVGGMSVQDEVADTGLMMMGHRFYAPDLGRFLNRDPIGFKGGPNLFEYAGGRPNQATDAAGLQPWPPVAPGYEFDPETVDIYLHALENPGSASLGQEEVEFLLGFNPVIGTGLSARDFYNERTVFTAVILAVSIVGLRSLGQVGRAARGTCVVSRVRARQSVGGFAEIYHVIQRGGNKLKSETARLLNEFFGTNLAKREWGRGLEAFKKFQGLGNADHNDIMNNADIVIRDTGEIIGNITEHLNDF